MRREELLRLDPKDITFLLTAEEIMHMAEVLGAFWRYDYQAKRAGIVGMHALLKSGQHSDGFIVSRIFLEHENILKIMANQIAMVFLEKANRYLATRKLDYVVGVPKGATELGLELAKILNVKPALMEKVDGEIVFSTQIKPGDYILVVEDFCTRGTGFVEAAEAIRRVQHDANIVPYAPVILNRGGLDLIETPETHYLILPVVERRIQDWSPVECPLCKAGSMPIKPKETDENWLKITKSQKRQCM